MAEPTHKNTPSQPPQSNGTRPSNPLTEPRRGSVISGEDKLKASLREGDMEAIKGMGSRAKPMLLKIVEDPEEDWFFRRLAADAMLSLHGDSVMFYERLFCLLLQEKIEEAASFGDRGVLQVLGMLKNKKENTLLRGMCIDAVVCVQKSAATSSTLSVVAVLSSLLANEQEAPVLRAKIADVFPGLAGICDRAKINLMKSALEKAMNSGDSAVSACAADALQLIGCSPEFVVDDNPTLPVGKK